MQNDNDMAGRIMAHAFNDELDKLAASDADRSRRRRRAAAGVAVGAAALGAGALGHSAYTARQKALIRQARRAKGKGILQALGIGALAASGPLLAGLAEGGRRSRKAVVRAHGGHRIPRSSIPAGVKGSNRGLSQFERIEQATYELHPNQYKPKSRKVRKMYGLPPEVPPNLRGRTVAPRSVNLLATRGRSPRRVS